MGKTNILDQFWEKAGLLWAPAENIFNVIFTIASSKTNTTNNWPFVPKFVNLILSLQDSYKHSYALLDPFASKQGDRDSDSILLCNKSLKHFLKTYNSKACYSGAGTGKSHNHSNDPIYKNSRGWRVCVCVWTMEFWKEIVPGGLFEKMHLCFHLENETIKCLYKSAR